MRRYWCLHFPFPHFFWTYTSRSPNPSERTFTSGCTYLCLSLLSKSEMRFLTAAETWWQVCEPVNDTSGQNQVHVAQRSLLQHWLMQRCGTARWCLNPPPSGWGPHFHATSEIWPFVFHAGLVKSILEMHLKSLFFLTHFVGPGRQIVLR